MISCLSSQDSWLQTEFPLPHARNTFILVQPNLPQDDVNRSIEDFAGRVELSCHT
jgi:hypothetical protein